jgi:lipoyl(octanoyl) transferase
MRANRTTAKDSRPPRAEAPREFAAHFHLLGCVDYEDCLTLQRRLAYDALTRGDGRLAVLIGEHPPLVTIGRAGSRLHVRVSSEELAARRLEIRYVGRGGGAVLHGPGQLAVYVIAPLAWHGWNVGAYLRQLQAALQATLVDLQLRPNALPGSYSLAGRTGVLAAVAVAVRHGVACHGAFINVNPQMRDQARIEVAPGRAMSSVLSERPLPVRMATVRAALVAHLAAAFGCQRHHLHTGHPHLAELPSSDICESAA